MGWRMVLSAVKKWGKRAAILVLLLSHLLLVVRVHQQGQFNAAAVDHINAIESWILSLTPSQEM